MSKAPAFQFYVKDWLCDTKLKMASFSTKGIWIDLLCYMWVNDIKGELISTWDSLKKLIGASEYELTLFKDEAALLDFCYISVSDNKIITLRNRRMFRDEKHKKSNRERQARYQAKHKSNENITPPSSSSSPKKKYIKKKSLSFEEAKVALDESKIEYARKHGHDNGSVDVLFEAFKAHHIAKGNVFKNWDQAWHKWVLQDIQYHGKPKSEPKGGISKPWT